MGREGEWVGRDLMEARVLLAEVATTSRLTSDRLQAVVARMDGQDSRMLAIETAGSERAHHLKLAIRDLASLQTGQASIIAKIATLEAGMKHGPWASWPIIRAAAMTIVLIVGLVYNIPVEKIVGGLLK